MRTHRKSKTEIPEQKNRRRLLKSGPAMYLRAPKAQKWDPPEESFKLS